jgi:hypothetical protein
MTFFVVLDAPPDIQCAIDQTNSRERLGTPVIRRAAW